MLRLYPPRPTKAQLLQRAASGRGEQARKARQALRWELHKALAEGLGRPLPPEFRS